MTKIIMYKLFKSQNIKAEVEILLKTDMNSINGWDSTKRAKPLCFIVVPQVRTEIRRKCNKR